MTSAYPRPILVRTGMQTEHLERVPLTVGKSAEYDEAWLQRLLFEHPECIPVAELDPVFTDLVPIAMEVATNAGPIDVLYATPTGRLVVLEAKLWRNPEARRKVVGQILDYAKELTKTDYVSLDGRVKAARAFLPGAKEDGIAAVVRRRFPNIDEATFVDGVTRSMSRGEFLLLIAGDGIREGAGAITEFLQQHGTLHFTFGLVEMAIYAMPDGSRLVQPRIVAQSEILRRIVISVEGSRVVVEENAQELEDSSDTSNAVSPGLEETRRQFSAFWDEFLRVFRPKLRDQNQPLPEGSRSQNLYFYLPKPANGWISAYVAQSQGEVGVYLTFTRGPLADRLYESLVADRDLIEQEMGSALKWSSVLGKHMVVLSKPFPGQILEDHREEAISWMSEYLNRFISVFRGRVDRLVEGLQ